LSSSNRYIINRIINYLADECTRNLCALLRPKQLAAVLIEVMSQHVAGSLYATLAWWLSPDVPCPPEAMAEMVFQLCQVGVKGFFLATDYRDKSTKWGNQKTMVAILGKASDVEPEEYAGL
jgi:hypothetical protein